MATDAPWEVPLPGGRTIPGIVRVGDTVRRPLTPNSDFARRLLCHLAAGGFDGAPAWLGTDEQGRDVLGFIEGEVPSELSWHGDAVLAAAAALICRYHDATADLMASPAAEEVGIEVACHNDLSPCNTVFRSGLTRSADRLRRRRPWTAGLRPRVRGLALARPGVA